MRQFLTAGVSLSLLGVLFLASNALAQEAMTGTSSEQASTDEGGKSAVAGAAAGEGASGTFYGFRSVDDRGIQSLIFNLGTGTSKVKTATFGPSTLDPGTASRGFQLYINQVLNKKKSQSVGSLFLRFSGSMMDFEGDVEKTVDGVKKNETLNTSGHLLSYTVGLQKRLDTRSIKESAEKSEKVALGIAAGYTWRAFGGDITQSSNSALRDVVFGANGKKQYGGWEVALSADLGDVQPFIQFTTLRGPEVSGLTGNRITLGVRALTDFFKSAPSDEPSNQEDKDAKDATTGDDPLAIPTAAVPPVLPTIPTNPPAVPAPDLNQHVIGMQRYAKAVEISKIGAKNLPDLPKKDLKICLTDPISGKCFLATVDSVEGVRSLDGTPNRVQEIASLSSRNNRILLRLRQPVLVRGDDGAVYVIRRERRSRTKKDIRGLQKF